MKIFRAMNFNIAFILAPSLFSCTLTSQILPSFGPVFAQNEVTTVRITIDPDSLQTMIDDQDNEHEYAAMFVFESSTILDTVDLVGFRLRGNTSLSAEKKSFKISFNTFDDNFDWQGLEKLNLVAQHNDPSIMRSKICHDAFRYCGVPAARTSYTKLFVNDEYRGIYLNVEQIDEQFANLYFDEQGDGNLYKCTYPATLEYISDNPDDYQFALWGTRHYELKTNNWRDDYSDLAHFIDVLVNTPIADLSCELPLVFNVEGYLKIAAMDVLLGNWDGYIYNKNNFYLYLDQHTGQINYMPYDLDNTLGIDWLGQDWANRNIYDWAPSGEARPLFDKLMLVDEYRDQYSYYINKYCQEYFNITHLEPIVENWKNLIDQDVEIDTYYPLDYGFTYEDFLNSGSESWGGQIAYGILDYVDARRSSALQQSENFAQQQIAVHYLYAKWPPGIEMIKSLITGDVADTYTLLQSDNGIDYLETGITDESGFFSQYADDGIFTHLNWTWPISGDKHYYQLQLQAGDLYPCEPAFFWVTKSAPGLYLNEVMPVNVSTIADEFGEYDDWVELYNGTNNSINLAGRFLTDDLFNWNNFPLPDVNIPANGFLLIWLDDDTEQGALHANFKLTAGESLRLISLEAGQPRITDVIDIMTQLADYSTERITDGSENTIPTDEPTPGYSNNSVNITENNQDIILVFPNPANDFIQFSKMVNYAEVIDATGRVVAKSYRTKMMDISSLESGVYFIHLDHIIVQQIIVL